MEHPGDFELLTSKAELLKAVAHPVRLCIVRGLLEQGECNVNTIQSCLQIPQSTISQHLGKLRDAGIIKGNRQGVEIFYKVVNEDLKKVIAALFW
ncbi:helix-turn-helix transcriptional regulator [Geobacter sp. SVR]|uniref:ArsR/SmtB family transcription factor n=1 Tax=Geobacter sp. SVR TaxID=2495594 RepID=UPI00143EF4A5|nr:metalloregulator ArsR/SmtB family transcription factor [Geobacter sp. SVR]BCS54347.1 transcriptional regulator [Geobacter sp. SVR]GCF87484.1 transcriptional regulator [Geobacter sp. SVR]